MPFTPKNWQDGSGGGTPLDATALEDLETRVTDYAEQYADSLGGRLIHADTMYGDNTLAYKSMAAGAVRTIYKNTGLTTPLAISYTPSEDCWADVHASVGLVQCTTGNALGALCYGLIEVTGALPTLNGATQPTTVRGTTIQGEHNPSYGALNTTTLLRLTSGVAYTFTAKGDPAVAAFEYFQSTDRLWITLKAWALA